MRLYCTQLQLSSKFVKAAFWFLVFNNGDVIFQANFRESVYQELAQRYNIDANLAETMLQQRLEEIRESLRKEIRRELKIKEGAENLRKATTDKKSLSNVNSIVKKSNLKLQELQQELNELSSHLLMANKSGISGMCLVIRSNS